MNQLECFAKHLQARAARMPYRPLIAVFIVAGGLAGSVCGLVLCQAIRAPPPVLRVIPIVAPLLPYEQPTDMMTVPPFK